MVVEPRVKGLYLYHRSSGWLCRKCKESDQVCKGTAKG